MGDFLLDLRPKARRQIVKAGQFLRFFDDMTLSVFDHEEFGLVITSADAPHLWAPYAAPDGSVLVALCGRVSLAEEEWKEADGLPNGGGAACRLISSRYLSGGIREVEKLSGNFVIIIFDRHHGRVLITTDKWGLVPVFESATRANPVFASHPDALADAVGESGNWDLTSLTEFVLTGKVSFPFSYYLAVRGVEPGSTTTVDLSEAGQAGASRRRHFQYAFDVCEEQNIEIIAGQFAEAWQKAVSRRTLPRLGRAAVALSGGLDSRTILCAAENRTRLISFSFFDEENFESSVAQAVAKEAGVSFTFLRRPFDYYADWAELGVKISGGMGCIASNHFLGFRRQLQDLGVVNLLTGCYCDYVFKGLALNKRHNPWTTVESLAPVSHQYYAPHFLANTPLARAVGERLDSLSPLRDTVVEADVLDLEQERIFPLAYEADNAERVIPQRVLGWYPPIAEDDLMAIYLRMPISFKLNRTLWIAMVKRVCGERISEIPDANTGAAVGAPLWAEAWHCHVLALKRGLKKLRRSIATAGSWPDWSFYINNSPAVRALWERPNHGASDLFREMLGVGRFEKDVGAYRGGDVYLFLQLFTLKLWLDQRSC